MITSLPAFCTSVVSRCKPTGSCLPVLASACWTRLAQRRPIRLVRQFGAPPPCPVERFDDTHRRLHHRQSPGKRYRQPLRSPCATPVPTVRFNSHNPSSPVIWPSIIAGSPQSAQTLVFAQARSLGPPPLRRAAKDNSPPPGSLWWHHSPPASLHSLSLTASSASRYLVRPSNTGRFNGTASSLATTRRFLSITMSPPQQRPSAAAGRFQKRVERVTDQLEKPSLDDRTYRVIRLPNQLEVLLVHDPETDKASAAMDVNVGAFSDEEDMPGMAHAVEHVRYHI